jgi:hypothetical protein
MSQWIGQYWLETAHCLSLVALLVMCLRESRRADRWERMALARDAIRKMHEAKTRVWRRDN